MFIPICSRHYEQHNDLDHGNSLSVTFIHNSYNNPNNSKNESKLTQPTNGLKFKTIKSAQTKHKMKHTEKEHYGCNKMIRSH